MTHPLMEKIATDWPPADWTDVTVLVALSGGGDSVALLRALKSLKRGGAGRLCAAHLNHALRQEADADQQFVAELCRSLDIHCEIGRVEVARHAAGGEGLESIARRCRYRFLEEAAGRLGARFVAVAHTADDQVETILHRVIRGTGVRGLSGMSRVRPLGHATLIRPMLNVRRAEVLAYLNALGQPFREDASNRDSRFTRNRIRRKLLPLLREYFNAGVDDALLRLGALAGQSQAAIDWFIDRRIDEHARFEGNGDVEIALDALTDLPPFLRGELLHEIWRLRDWPRREMDFARWAELAELCRSASARRDFPGGIRAQVADGRLRLSRGGMGR
jgi:tRNA(Ile)-lysidine synthase